MPSTEEKMFIMTLDPKAAGAVHDKRYAGMIGLDVTHHYVGIFRPGDRIEIRFLNLPDLNRTFDIADYQKELELVLRQYLMEKHETMTDEERKSFAKLLSPSGSVIGHVSLFGAARLVFGYVKLH